MFFSTKRQAFQEILKRLAFLKRQVFLEFPRVRGDGLTRVRRDGLPREIERMTFLPIKRNIHS